MPPHRRRAGATPRDEASARAWAGLWRRHRSRLGWGLAALSVAALAAAAAVPFLGLPFAWAAGGVASLLVCAEILAALAFVALGKDLHRWIRDAVASLRRGDAADSDRER